MFVDDSDGQGVEEDKQLKELILPSLQYQGSIEQYKNALEADSELHDYIKDESILPRA